MAVSDAGDEPAPTPLARPEHLTQRSADVESYATRRERAAYRAGRIDALKETLEERYAAFAGLERLEQMSLPELEALADIVACFAEAKATGEPHALHLVAQATGNRPGRERLTPHAASANDGAPSAQRGALRHRPPIGEGVRPDTR